MNILRDIDGYSGCGYEHCLVSPKHRQAKLVLLLSAGNQHRALWIHSDETEMVAGVSGGKKHLSISPLIV